jgi:SDR family mycofactocin-dependent oxidoreductase
MGNRVAGKVALITGAGRGQGRSHAVRLAEEGADIIALDICEPIESMRYPLSSEEDLAETARMVEAHDRRILTRKGDVRDRGQLKRIVEEGIAEFGHLDVMVANAGILPVKDRSPQAFVDALDVDFFGVHNTIAAVLPHLQSGASIVVTGSTAGMIPGMVENPALGPGGSGYGLAKKMLISYTEALALQLAPLMIRLNTVHPTNVNTHLIHNEDIYKVFRPDIENPTREEAEEAFMTTQAMPIACVDPIDISNAVLYFASDESRYVTGVQLRVDAGSLLKTYVLPS